MQYQFLNFVILAVTPTGALVQSIEQAKNWSVPIVAASVGMGLGLGAVATTLAIKDHRRRITEGYQDTFTYEDIPHSPMPYDARIPLDDSYKLALQNLKLYKDDQRDCETTLISLFYPEEGQPGVKMVRRPLTNYLRRISRLVSIGRPIIIYTTPEIGLLVRAMRADPYLIIVDQFASVQDIPSNLEHIENFLKVQPELFPRGQLTGEWNTDYNRPHNMMVYNAKAWITKDAVERNPFGSNQFMFTDAGIFEKEDPLRQSAWGETIAIRNALSTVPEDSIVISQIHPLKAQSHRCWKEPLRLGECHAFAGGAWFGKASGMIRFSEAMMREFELMNANKFYVGREEFIMSRVAVSNPGLVIGFQAWKYSVNPWRVLGKALAHSKPLEVRDPLAPHTDKSVFLKIFDPVSYKSILTY